MKEESDIRWSARADAILMVCKKYFQLVNVLEEMNELVAFVVLNDISNYYFCLLLLFLDGLLQHITCVSYGFKIHPSTSVMQPVILVS